ncbi:hypothetical protein AAFF_G00286320 [Aldrovandia affinis]|uniref:IF rod domain-containing protein n=1 Tax=Aldrovandia affinis TaxID=143900 RepID=A0AAD7X216_9TELE|nr:hypothetical protein AAFF_G00286320 [Aldrovandia affinis]
MLQFRRAFENEKIQLQDLNTRLSQYLSRVKQLEQENALLITEINSVRQEKTVEWENKYLPELKEVRRAVGQLASEKSKAEIERDRLWREFQTIQALCSEETVVCRDIEGERKGCEKQLQQALKKNAAMEERLLQLENEYRCMEDVHRQDVSHLRNEVHSRAVPVAVTQRYEGPPAITMEEIEGYALTLSESWMDNFEVYRRRVDDLEESIKADQAKLEELHREKTQYASELKKLCAEANKQNQLQLHLEEQLINMQDRCILEIDQYQGIVGELEEQHRLMAQTIAEKLKEHQQLMQVKMGLSLEVAAYRALLEGERKDPFQKMDQYAREASRRIDIKMPAQPWSTTNRKEGWKQYPLNTGPEAQYIDLASSLKASFGSTHFRSTSPVRVVPISVYARDQQSTSTRRDMPSFTKASQAAANVPKKTTEEKSVRSKEAPQKLVKDSASQRQPGLATRPGPSPPPKIDKRPVVLPPMMSAVPVSEEGDDKHNFRGLKIEKMEDTDTKTDTTKVTVREWTTPGWEEVKSSDVSEMSEVEVQRDDPEEADSSDEKTVDYIYMEEIIEKVMRPAGLDKFCPSPDSKVAYHVEKTEEDGTTTTQIILESKIEEDLDITDDAAMEMLLRKGVKKVTLEDLKGTPTGSMIQNLLSLGGACDLKNKSVNVEITEEAGEGLDYEEGEANPNPSPTFFQPSSMFFQIEELETDSHSAKLPQGKMEVKKSATTEETEYRKDGSVWVREGLRDADVPYISQAQDTEYFVSTPDDSVSEPEEERGISSYGHYGVVDDLSDERYYQEVHPINPRFEEEPGYRSAPRTSYMTSEHTFTKGRFPECIIEEEVQVSPTEQESMLELLTDDSMDPKQQLRGALEKLQGTVSESLQEEIALLTKSDQEASDNLTVDVKKVQQVSDNGMVTITAELNVSQSLEDFALEEDAGSNEQVLAAVPSSHSGLQHAIETRSSGGYTMEASRDQDTEMQSAVPGSLEGLEGSHMEESAKDIHKTERVIRLGPSERSLTFQMEVGNAGKDTSLPVGSGAHEFQGFFSEHLGSGGPNSKEVHEGVYSYVRQRNIGEDQGDELAYSQGHEGEVKKWEGFTKEQVEFGHVMQTQFLDPQFKDSQEKRIATLYLESAKED